MVIKVGIIGLSKGNGHPYSFSSIINGFSERHFNKSEWPGIYNYLMAKSPLEIEIHGMEVVAAWSQNITETEKICNSGRIPNACKTLDEMTELIDAVIIARDDWQSHFSIAKNFLESGKYVFIDKPLTLDKAELEYFLPFLRSGKLMSCGALRYAQELDTVRSKAKAINAKFFTATVLNDWNKYGIHMIDAIFGLNCFKSEDVVSVTAAGSDTYVIKIIDDREIVINCIGEKAVAFNISIYSQSETYHISISDNFTAFRRTLLNFREMILSGKPTIDPSITEVSIRILMAGQISKEFKKEIFLNE